VDEEHGRVSPDTGETIRTAQGRRGGAGRQGVRGRVATDGEGCERHTSGLFLGGHGQHTDVPLGPGRTGEYICGRTLSALRCGLSWR
jgi:hypothetical protein